MFTFMAYMHLPALGNSHQSTPQEKCLLVSRFGIANITFNFLFGFQQSARLAS